MLTPTAHNPFLPLSWGIHGSRLHHWLTPVLRVPKRRAGLKASTLCRIFPGLNEYTRACSAYPPNELSLVLLDVAKGSLGA